MMGRLQLVFMILATGIFIGPVVGQQAGCPNGENYEPCTCSYEYAEYSVRCDQVRVEDVFNVFNRTTPSSLKLFYFSLSPNDASNDSIITIPADLLKEHQVRYIQIYGPIRSSTYYKLWVEPQAFRSSRNSTLSFYLRFWDTRRLDFDFLTGFDKLYELPLYYATNVHLANWTSLPPLQSLTTLSIGSSTGLNEWDTFPSLIRGLVSFNMPSNDIQSVAMDRILNWTVGHSANTLEHLSIVENDLRNIPLQILSLKVLKDFRIDSQKTGIPSIPSGSIKLSGQSPLLFSAGFNKIEKIEPGALQGDFSRGYVYLRGNNIQAIDPGVFQPDNFKSAYIYLSDNKIQTVVPGAFQGNFSRAFIDLSYNNISTIVAGAFQGNFNGTHIELRESNAEQIESGAFQGDFRYAGVYLGRNNIQKIEPGAFEQGNFSGSVVELSSNNFSTILAGTFRGDFSGASVYLEYSNIETIEPGAFQGNFSGASVSLYDNELTRFEELVFKELLEQMMADQSSGFLSAPKNPFDCQSDPCHLAWLVRDNPWLLDRLSASCSDGTPFQQLKPASKFAVCRITNSSIRPIAHNLLAKIIVASILAIVGKIKFL